jgi:hypothetical protein
MRPFDRRRFAFLAQRQERTEARTRLFTLTSAGLYRVLATVLWQNNHLTLHA